jgi:hypothetical protein
VLLAIQLMVNRLILVGPDYKVGVFGATDKAAVCDLTLAASGEAVSWQVQRDVVRE